MSSFADIGLKAGTDKITHHGYQRFYPTFLENIRKTATAILEIGIDRTYSVQLWSEYFTFAKIYGMDIHLEYETDRVKIIKGDQSSVSDLANVSRQIKEPVQFIIDDGSHIPEHQLLTFDFFFQNLLQPGGIYIVEDIETSYWKNGDCYGYPTKYGYKHPRSFIERIKPVIDHINIEFLNTKDQLQNKHELVISQTTLDMISTMTFGQNCVIFTKKTADEMKYNGRVYRFNDRTRHVQ
jgi:hypothetical protein